jgi:hypothetical protein
MTKRSDKDKFDRIVGAIDDTIFAASRAELEAEYREAGRDPAGAAARARDKIAAAITAHGKKAMRAAKERARRAAEAAPPLQVATLSRDSAEARGKLARLLKRPGAPTTLAARDGKGMSDNDVESLIADLAELGITEGESDR